MRELFVTFEELEELEGEYNLEDNGMSGKYIGYHWFTATNEEETIELYV